MEKFFLLKTMPNSNNKIASNESMLDYDQMDLLTGKVIAENNNFTVKKGFEKFDFLETGWPGILLCSQRVVDFFKANNVQGCSFSNVTLVCKRVVTAQQYAMLHVHGRSGPFDYSKSEVVGEIDYSFINLKGRYFNTDSVKGSDIFTVDKTVMIFITERLKELMDLEKFTNLSLVDNTEFTGSVLMSVYKTR